MQLGYRVGLATMMDQIMKATLEAVDTTQATRCQPPSLGSSAVDPAGIVINTFPFGQKYDYSKYLNCVQLVVVNTT